VLPKGRSLKKAGRQSSVLDEYSKLGRAGKKEAGRKKRRRNRRKFRPASGLSAVIYDYYRQAFVKKTVWQTKTLVLEILHFFRAR
jgi:hypothetical protein